MSVAKLSLSQAPTVLLSETCFYSKSHCLKWGLRDYTDIALNLKHQRHTQNRHGPAEEGLRMSYTFSNKKCTPKTHLIQHIQHIQVTPVLRNSGGKKNKYIDSVQYRDILLTQLKSIQ